MKKLKGPNSFPRRKEVYVVLEIEDCLFGCGAEGDGRGQMVLAAGMPFMGGSNSGLDLLQDSLHVVDIGQSFIFSNGERARGQ